MRYFILLDLAPEIDTNASALMMTTGQLWLLSQYFACNVIPFLEVGPTVAFLLSSEMEMLFHFGTRFWSSTVQWLGSEIDVLKHLN